MYNDIKNHKFKIELGGQVILTQQSQNCSYIHNVNHLMFNVQKLNIQSNHICYTSTTGIHLSLICSLMIDVLIFLKYLMNCLLLLCSLF